MGGNGLEKFLRRAKERKTVPGRSKRDTMFWAVPSNAFHPHQIGRYMGKIVNVKTRRYNRDRGTV